MAINLAWLAAHKAAAAAGAGVLGLAVMSRKKKAATGPPAGGASAAPNATTTGTYDSTAQDVYGSIEPQLGLLQSQIANLKNTAPATTPTDPHSSWFKTVGGGIQNIGAGDYSIIQGQSQGEAAFNAGEQLYFEPSVGVYAPIDAAMLKRIYTPGDPFANTPGYLKAGPGATPADVMAANSTFLSNAGAFTAGTIH